MYVWIHTRVFSIMSQISAGTIGIAESVHLFVNLGPLWWTSGVIVVLIYLHRVLFMALARYAYSFHFTCIGHVDESCLYWFFSSQISRKTSQRVRYKAPGSHDDNIDACPDQRTALCYSHPKILWNLVLFYVALSFLSLWVAVEPRVMLIVGRAKLGLTVPPCPWGTVEIE